MPSDAVTLVVSTGIGFSLIAGILSGVCYVLAHGFSRSRHPKAVPHQWHCTVCGAYLRSIDAVLDGERIVTCSKCGKKVCKLRCAKYRPAAGRWVCQTCAKQSPWFRTILNAVQGNSRQFLFGNSQATGNHQMESCQIDEDVEVLRKKEKEQVRDFIERLVASMLGGNVDDISVARIYNDKSYDALFEKYHQDLSNALIDLGSALRISISNLPVSGQSPCTAHATLKQIIERLLRESLDLPGLHNRVEEHPGAPAPENDRTYEDLLATAIINKVVNNYQNNLPSSSAASVSSRVSSSSNRNNRDNNKEYFFGEETLESKWKNTDLDTTSVSSLEEWMQSDSSVGSMKFVDRVSLTIQQRIEESARTDSENEEVDEDEDDVDHLTNGNDSEYFRSSSALLLSSNDDDSSANWYLQKRNFRGASHSPVPVPMLVPNPMTEAKVLIGDQELDETSDLSDALSDYGDTEAAPDVKSLLVESKMVIGGKNVTRNLHEANFNRSDDAESSGDSGVHRDDTRAGDLADYEKTYGAEDDAKPKSDITVDDENVEDASLLSIYSNTEKDTEYTERYASLPRTVLKTPASIPDTNQTQSAASHPPPVKSTTEVKSEEETKRNNNIPDVETITDEDGLFEGSYSKKEKDKWNHPIEMPYNPYTKENIERRMTASKIFGRDYYARQASSPSGGKKAKEENGESWSPRIFDIEPDDNVYRAVPTTIIDDSKEPHSEEHITVKEPPIHSRDEYDYSEITSDSDLSLVNCYDVENSKIYRKSSDGGEEEIRITVNTEGLLYTAKDPETGKPLTNGEKAEIKSDIDRNLSPSTISYEEQEVSVSVEPEITPYSSSNGLPSIDLSPQESKVASSNVPPTEIMHSEKMPQVKPRLNIKPLVLQPTPIPKKRTEISTTSVVVDIKSPVTPKKMEDGFSRTPPTIIQKKSDNTLIKKIYSDPTVRSFVALTNREQIPFGSQEDSKPKTAEASIKTPEPEPTRVVTKIEPIFLRPTKSVESSPVKTPEPQIVQLIPKTEPTIIVKPPAFDVASLEKDDKDSMFSLESSSDIVLEQLLAPLQKQRSIKKDPEISELMEKRLVANRLGEFSRSFPNLTRAFSDSNSSLLSVYDSKPVESSSSTLNLAEHEGAGIISVKDLKRRFESNDALAQKSKPVHSLTARSLSKPIRDSLKNQDSMDSVESTHAEDSPRGEIEEIHLNAENAIKFYEMLK